MIRAALVLVLCVGCAKSKESDGGVDASRDTGGGPIVDASIVDTERDCPPAVLARRCGDPLDTCAFPCACGTRDVLETCDVDDTGSCFRSMPFCEALERRRWESRDELECGLGDMGVVRCNWQINFVGGRFDWSYSDVFESGAYTCTGDRVLSDRVEGRWEPMTGSLIWDDVLYVALPEACPD